MNLMGKQALEGNEVVLIQILTSIKMLWSVQNVCGHHFTRHIYTKSLGVLNTDLQQDPKKKLVQPDCVELLPAPPEDAEMQWLHHTMQAAGSSRCDSVLPPQNLCCLTQTNGDLFFQDVLQVPQDQISESKPLALLLALGSTAITLEEMFPLSWLLEQCSMHKAASPVF